MGRTRNHGHYVCSTWGNNHFKTFDGDIYQFPGICEYNFASDCQESYKEFSVHIQRALNSNNHPEIQYILITMKDFTVYLRPKLAVVDGRIVKTPYYSSGLLIESNDIYTKVYAKLGLILIWNQEDALMVELDSKFNNHTCGLCGDYNGVPIYNEFINGVASYNSITYGNLQKISRPNTKCEDPDETQALPSCNEHRNECERLLTSSAFADCRLRLNLELYIQACMQDKCACNGNEDSFCLCSTISEYSRQCSHAGGRPGEWRTQYFCPKTCPDTMIYRESSSPCMDTCSHLEISSLCEEHYMDGCFCPEGTVYDDITEKGCILASQCHCKLHGKEYSPGESITNECEECTCDSGRWTCKDLPCPGTCSVEGGSHITTFDGKKYTFHGDCYYVLAKGTVNDSHALLAELSPCGSTDRQTCLKTVVLLADHKKNVVVFRSDGSVLLNEMTVNVPHVSASFSVFKPSSYYLVAQTSFGLQLQIQLFPVMQLFVTVDQSVQGKLQGLCGNFNGMEGDDFKTTSGLVEATGSAFANTWKAQSTCTDQVEKLEDPCSLSTESANYAEHWCSLLKNSEGPFARCHLIIDPSEYYKKCKYDTCLCEDNEECLCAALSSYSRACAFKGIILGGWRKNVCTSEMSACPGNQIFLYNLTMCQQTCRSLAGGEKHCLQDFPPMDGCGCPYNTYLDNQDTCVPISKCPCYYKGSYLEPGEYVTKDGERCVCRNAKVQCTSVTIKMKNTTECSSNKMYFDCNASPKWTSQTPLQLSCHTPRTDHFQAECVSGCVCPEGLFDDGKGGCVEEKDCPCIHNNQWYSPGQKIAVDCNTCTCQKGLWTCTEDVCYGTCMIYGSGHYITFDGKFYDFDGSCDYVATQDFCGDKNSSGSFSIITENVPCGTTGVTCSKAIKMFLGKTELKLENKDYKEIQRDIGDDVRYWNRTVGLYLVIEASNGVMLIWDKKTTVFIKLTPDYKGKVCGLCGNFDDKSNNDFTTRSGLQETNALKFGNSWKQSSMCPDITQEIKPCDVKPHRKSWAEKECSIIRSEVFKICHSKVDPIPFYEACVHDACSCDSGGDCECFCSAVAAYAQECTKAQACVFWRTPDICPIFCDYYNPRNECDWHYEPCGSNVTTCRMINNVSTNFSVPYLEGCYPRCPKDKPVYNEETKECVPEDQCWCYINGTHVPPGSEIPTEENCTKCVCGPSGSIQCTPIPGCPCVINGTSYEVGEIVAQIQDGNICITYICAENGSIVVGSTYPCPTSTSPTTVSTSFPTSTLTTTVVTTSPPVTTTPCFGLICNWTQWFDVSKPEEDGGDYETYDAIRKEHGNKICEAPEDIECRAKDNPDMSLEELGQKVECNVTYGLICKNEEQDATMWQLCYNYEIRVNCCEWSEISCETTSTLSPTPTATSTTTSTTVPITTTVRQSTAVTTMPIPTPTITSKFTSSVTTPVTSTSPAPPSSTTRTVSPPPVSTTAPTPTPSEPPSSTATTTMPPRSTTSSTLGTTTMVSGTPAPTPTTATTSMPTPTYTTTSSPPDCDCIWTDWIDVSYPNSSDRNSGDYETFENILKNDSSWVCAKAENISCRAEKFPHIPIADLGQKVECSVNTGLICNNSDQVIGGIIPMPVCLNYEISVCCIPNIPQCITSTTTSTTTAPPSSTTRTVSPPPVSTTAPTPTPSEPPSSTATTTMPPRSTTSSTLGTTTMVPGTPAPTPTTATTFTPPTIITKTPLPPSSEAIKGTTPESGTLISTTVTPSATPQPTTRTTEIQSTVSTTGTTIQQSKTSVSTSPVTVSTSGVTETGPTTKTTTSGPTPHSTTTVMETSSHETSTTGTGSPPTGPPSSTTSTTTSGPSSPMSTASTTVSPPPVSTSPVTVSTSGVTETGPTTKTTTSGPTPHSTTTVMETSSHETSTTGTGSPPTGPPSSTTSTTTSGPSSPMSTASTTVSPPPVSTSPVTVSTSGVTETGPTTKTTTSGPTPHSTTTVMETSSHETSTTGTGSPPTGPPSSTTSTTTSGPSSPMSTASTTVSPPPVSTSPVTVSTSGVTETGPTTKTTTSGPTPHSTTTVMETSSHETSTTGTGSPPTGPPSSTTSTTTSGPSSPMSTASTTVSPPPVSTSPVTVSTSGVTETGPTTKTTTSGPTPHSTTTVMETSSHETSTTGTGSPPTGPPSSTTSTTTSGPSSPMSTASTTVSPPPVSTSPVTVSTSGVTETGPTTKTTTSGPTPHSTTTVMETSSHETSTTGTGSPPTGPPSSTTSTTTSGPSSPMSTASTTVSPPPVSTSPVTVSTSGVTETGPTTKTTTSGPTPHSTTTVMETSSHETSTTGTGSPPTGPPSSTTSTTTSGPSSPMSTASTTVSPPPVSTSPVTVSTSGVTETGPTTKTTTSGPTPHSTTTVMETSSHETSTTGTGSPPTGPPSSTTSTTTSGPSSPMSTASTTVSPPPVSTSPVTVSTSGVTETGPTTKTTTSGPTPHSTTTVMETSSHETSTTGTGSPPTGPPSSTTSTTTSGPSSPMSTASTTVSPPPVSTSPVTVSTSGVTETGPTTKTTTSGPTPHSTTTVMETSSHETSTTGTGSPPTGPPSSTTSTTTSGPSSPMSTASTTVSPPPVSTSPVTVSTSGVTETGPTTKTTTSGPTPHSTTTVMETSSHETSTTGTGSPPTGPPSSTTSTTTSGPSSPMSTASTTVSPPPVSTSPVTVSTSGVTETGPTTKTTTSGPTPHSTTTVMETSSHETSTTGTGSPPTGPPSSTTSTTTSGPSSPMSTASTTVSPPPVSTSPVTVSTSGVTETGPTTKTTTSGPTPHSTTTVMETSSHETSTTGTGSPPTGPPSSTTSTTTSGPSSPMSTASTTVSPPPVSTSPVTVSTSGVTETGSTATSGPTLSGPTSHSTTTVTVTGSTMPTTATRTTPTRSTVITTTMTSGRSSIESTAITTLSPPSVSTSIMPVTTSGTTPTESFTTTSGTTSRNFTTITATTTTSSSEYFPPGSTSTSGPTATSSSVTITGSSTYSTVTPLSASSSTTSPPPTTPGRNCSVFPNESYAPGESWWICDCIKAICIEDNIIQVVPVICNPPPKPTCANGLSPVQVIDEDGCCWHWECDCYCTGWGDPHYMTFDGLYYSYQGNCTYVLVEEIHKKVDNFGVYIDNYHCDTRDVVSCPRTLIVRHETQEVRMATVKPNTLQVEVTVNKQAVALPYKKFGLSIYESGINRVVEIPELKMNVTYNGLSFSIRMPYSLFGNNTHGQCGTCNNNTADDCMLPNGNIAENCETMADHWQVVDPSKPQCSPGLIPTKAPSTTPRQPCKESSICELLLGSLFEPCHGFVQPEKYYAACVFDSCVLPNLDLECSSLQTYAATCADQSVCIDWRSHTNGVCSYKCPSDKEYRACGPIKEITCKSSQQNETSTKQVEGCFCPNGTMLYDSGVDVCVKTCGCVGVDKIPREFGEKFTIDCQDCICVEGGNGIVCEPHECAEQNKTSCDGEGFYEVNEVNSEDSCCPIVTCKCNTSLCTSKAPKCTLGFEVHSHIPSGQCCPVYQCVPKRVCVHQNAEFLPNSSVFVDKCQNCFCTNEVNISTQLNIILCEHIPCNTYCEPGYESQPVKGECCGRCVQTKCVIHTSHNSDLILSPGEFKNDPYNNCTIYSCVNIHNQLISSTSEITCPAFNEESCKPGTITFLPNGCCRTCAPLDSPTPCSVRQRKDFIVYKGCRSVDRVVMTECEGTCGTSSLYSAEANSMDHSCSCCRESRTTVREVELKCPTGHSVSHKYIYVESCSCQDTECSSSQSSELQSTEENDKASILNRIKRAISLTAK
ncbi:mucin-2 isoform X13 [Accipiter gentilis]|uniref:mucin-2 isoform X12 n=1 Tax=Astur gentilis TaxID=8957 RepID=UPI00210F2509|nr:mucin-2 isoform X12 [Accipiter gentilis]XP_049676668.1 mucin-2 isoform X13 [Accipiter gentilis]